MAQNVVLKTDGLTALPCLGGESVDGGTVIVAPGSCVFVLV